MHALNLTILGPALVAGLLVLATHVPLGAIVLSRGIVFIDIALAQVAALGVVFGTFMWGDVSPWVVQGCAIAAALGCSALMTWTDKRWPAAQEAIIGVIYVFAAAMQVILLSSNPNGGDSLKTLLVGQILWVTPTQLVVVGVIYAAVVALWYLRDLSRERLLFYGAFAIVITASVQIVGVLLVFASLIVPALATQHTAPRWRLIIAFNIGVGGYVGGLVLSALLDLPTGAAIVCVLIPVAILTATVVNRGGAKAPVMGHHPVDEAAISGHRAASS
jgi:zinc/manganese transport system permease protein